MKRRQLLAWFLVGLFSCLVAVGCNANAQKANSGADVGKDAVTPVTITVSAAASLQDALEAIAPQFGESYPNITVTYNFGSSGALQQQIEQGAPADVFFSAAAKQMDALAQKALILTDSRQNVVTNSLVLIAPKDSTLAVTDLTQLKGVPISHFAVGEFRSVPAGQYAEQTLKHLGLLETLQSKFIFGNNVRGVLTAVASGNADLGMVYATDAALSDQVKVLVTAPESSHQSIVYPIAALKQSLHPEAAQSFIDFLTSEPAQVTFESFGFGRVH